MLTFPAEDMSRNKPRVRFIPQSWEHGKPMLAHTVGSKLNKSNGEIMLYLPGNFNEAYGAQWVEEDVVTALTNPSTGAVLTSGAEALDNAATAQFGGIMTSAKYNTGLTSFPGRLLVFKSADSVKLNFNFELIPKSAAEAKAIQSIVATFKRKLLPKYTGVLLEFPDVWNIQFLGIKGLGFPETPNAYLGMALTGVVPTYLGGTSTLAYHDEHPVGVSLALSFTSIKHSYIYGGQ